MAARCSTSERLQLAQIGTALIHAGVALLLKGRALQGKAVAQKRRANALVPGIKKGAWQWLSG